MVGLAGQESWQAVHIGRGSRGDILSVVRRGIACTALQGTGSPILTVFAECLRGGGLTRVRRSHILIAALRACARLRQSRLALRSGRHRSSDGASLRHPVIGRDDKGPPRTNDDI